MYRFFFAIVQITLAFILFTPTLHAQTCTSNFNAGISVVANTPNMGADVRNFIYHAPSQTYMIGGSYQSGTNFTGVFPLMLGPTPTPTYAQGQGDMFLTLINNAHFMTLTMGSFGEDLMTNLKQAPNGDVYILGTSSWSSGANYSPNLCPAALGTPLCNATLNTSSYGSPFLMKFAWGPQGFTYAWMKTFTINPGALFYIFDFTFDNASNPILWGSFNQTVGFDATMSLTSVNTATSSGIDSFVVKLNAVSGSALAAYDIGQQGAYQAVLSLAVDNTNVIRFTGYNNNKILFGKIDSSGTLTTNVFGPTNLNQSAQGNAIFVDGSGNYYLAGRYDATLDFDFGPATFILSPILAGHPAIFFVKYDAQDNFVAGTSFGLVGNTSGGDVTAERITQDSCGNVYLLGAVPVLGTPSPQLQLNPSGLLSTIVSPFDPVNSGTTNFYYLNKFDSSLNWLEGHTLETVSPNPYNFTQVNNLVSLPGGGVMVMGTFSNGDIYLDSVTSAGLSSPAPGQAALGVSANPNAGFVLYYN